MSIVEQPVAAQHTPDDFMNHLRQSMGGFLDILGIYLGERLGWYRSLAEHGPLSARQLAANTGTHERYAREWLDEQTTAGILTLEASSSAAGERRYCLPWAHRDALVNPDSRNYLAAQARVLVSLAGPLDELLAAIRSGAGLPEAAYGADLREGRAAANRTWYLDRLVSDVIGVLPDVATRLARHPATTVADIACGAGWAAIAIARAYPLARIDGFDTCAHAIRAARAHAAEAGVDSRVRFHNLDIVAWPPSEPYDLTLCCNALHTLPRPVELLRSMRRATRPEGVVLIGVPPAEDDFAGGPNPDERLGYGLSLFHDLPVSMHERPSAGTGGLLRPAVLHSYARAAGFDDIVALPPTRYARFFRLIPADAAITSAELARARADNLEWLEVP